MSQSDFLAFKSYFAENRPLERTDLQKIARHLSVGGNILTIARDLYRTADRDNDHDILQKFFHEVFRETGAMDERESRNWVGLLQAWQKNRPSNDKSNTSTNLVIETYYFLHTLRSGQSLASELDQLLLGGSFEERFNAQIPGGYYSESDISIPLTHSDDFHLGHAFHFSNRLIREPLGRRAELSKLNDFIECEGGFRWLQLAGVGGQGKSRLAYELISKDDPLWQKGFLATPDLRAFEKNWEIWRPRAKVLIVFDYVIGFEKEIGRALAVLARRSSELEHPVRVLLLERQPWNRGGVIPENKEKGKVPDCSQKRSEWFAHLNQSALESNLDLASSEFLFESGVIELTGLPPAELVQIVRNVAFAEERTIEQDDEFIKRQLQHLDNSASPLYAYLFSKALLSGSFRSYWGSSNILDFVLENNRNRRWKKYFLEDAPELIDDHPAIKLACLATIIGPLNFWAFDDEETDAWRFPNKETFNQALILNDTNIEEYGQRKDYIVPPLYPDILGEWFVLSCIKRPNLERRIVSKAWEIDPAKTAAFLLRLAQDFPLEHQTRRLFLSKTIDDLQGDPQATFIDAYIQLSFHSRSTSASLGGDFYSYYSINYPKNYRTLLCYSNGNSIHTDEQEELGCKFPENSNDRAVQVLNLYWLNQNRRDLLTEGLAMLSRAAKDGDPTALVNIGKMHLRGRFECPHDPNLALDLFKKAAALNDPAALDMVGYMYTRGLGGVDQDFDEARSYFIKAAEMGYAPAFTSMCDADLGGKVGRYWAARALEWQLTQMLELA